MASNNQRGPAPGGLWRHALVVAASAAALGLTAPWSANAQVLEIGEGGAVTVYDRPSVFLAEGATPIVPDPPAASAAAQDLHLPAALQDAAQTAELSPELIEAVAWRESRLRAGVVSRAGAIGEMQLMPGTARDLGVDPHDTRQNYLGGATYLRAMLRRYDGDVIRALAAYNAGPGAVDRYGGVPPYRETREYVSAIMERLSERVAPAGGGGAGR